MINILLKGVDEFLGAHVETIMGPAIANIYKVSNDDVVFTCMHSMIYHGGVDQTSYHMIVTVEAEKKYESFEKDVAEYILKASKDFAVHCHVNFEYKYGKSYDRIDEDYPLYVTNSNKVEIEETAEEEMAEKIDEEEIYTGNIFEDFEAKLAEAAKKKN